MSKQLRLETWDIIGVVPEFGRRQKDNEMIWGDYKVKNHFLVSMIKVARYAIGSISNIDKLISIRT